MLFKDRNKLLTTAEEVVRRLLKLQEYIDLKKPERQGGYFVLMDKIKDIIFFKAMIGNPDENGIKRYWHFSEVKAQRIKQNKSYFSSWQSMDISKKKLPGCCTEYGGAVTAPEEFHGLEEGKRYILSFSGLSEMGDEAVCTVVAMIFRWITLEDAKKIIKVSNNILIIPLVTKCNDLFDI
jgi:hypothetical protein